MEGALLLLGSLGVIIALLTAPYEGPRTFQIILSTTISASLLEAVAAGALARPLNLRLRQAMGRTYGFSLEVFSGIEAVASLGLADLLTSDYPRFASDVARAARAQALLNTAHGSFTRVMSAAMRLLFLWQGGMQVGGAGRGWRLAGAGGPGGAGGWRAADERGRAAAGPSGRAACRWAGAWIPGRCGRGAGWGLRATGDRVRGGVLQRLLLWRGGMQASKVRSAWRRAARECGACGAGIKLVSGRAGAQRAGLGPQRRPGGAEGASLPGAAGGRRRSLLHPAAARSCRHSRALR